MGSTLARLLETAGYTVTREYYVNDTGSQMAAFDRSIYARYKEATGQEAELPPGGYMGSYVMDLAQEIVAREGNRFLSMSEEDALRELGRIGRERMVQLIEEDLRYLRVEFDNWFKRGDPLPERRIR